MKALFFRPPQPGERFDPQALMDLCRACGMEVIDKGPAPDPENIENCLEKTSAAIFFPAIEEDCLGVKLTQDTLAQSPPNIFNGPPRVIALYARELPDKDYISLAFREGVDDIIPTSSSAEALKVHIKRIQHLHENRQGSSFNGGELKAELEKAQTSNRQLQCRVARLEESLQSLASTATRLATGELQFGQSSPTILIVATSHSQGETAAEVARRIGFEPRLAGSGAEALEIAREWKPREILTDGTLPDMDASALARTIRKDLGPHPVVIIAWSSNPEIEDKLLSPSGGLDDFVLKSNGRRSDSQLAAAFLAGLR